MIDKRLDELLQETYTFDNRSLREYRNLSEAQKLDLGKSLMDKTVRLVVGKAKNLDYGEIEKSAGSVRRLACYNDLAGAINALKNIQAVNNTHVEGVSIVATALKNLENLEPYFRKAFAVGNTTIELLYNNICVAFIASTAYLISSSMDMIKDDAGVAYYKPRPGAAVDTSMLKSLQKFNKMCLNGDIQRFINRILPEANFLGAGVAGGLIFAAGAMFIVVTVMIMIRQIVYQYYNMRVKLSDYMRINSEFLEMNKARLGSIDNMKGVAAKQGAMATKLNALADRIDVDQKTSSKKAELDVNMDNRSYSDTGLDANSDDLLF